MLQNLKEQSSGASKRSGILSAEEIARERYARGEIRTLIGLNECSYTYPALTKSPGLEATWLLLKYQYLLFPLKLPQPFTITAQQISRYAELSSLVSGLEAQQKQLRDELLSLRNAGAEQEETSPTY
ncbi:MAG: hypothetical protein JWO91_1226 [Acidobacteriaceae bacterium]|nr:hypothetical protein [Acidobacteriaceae bacterium]